MSRMLEQPVQFSIVAKAVAAGIFYQDMFTDHCRSEWLASFPATDQQLITNGGGTVRQGREYSSMLNDIQAALAAAPRGTWTTIGVLFDSGKVTNVGFVSDGAGGVHSKDRGPQDFASLLEYMVDLEIFRARRAYELDLQQQQARSRIQELGLRLGTVLKSIKLGSEAFSSAVIVGIDDSGLLHLTCSKRGSRKRFSAKWYAHDVELVQTPAAAESGLLF